MSDLSGYSTTKLKRIKDHWLSKTPVESFDFRQCRYLLYDATGFGKKKRFKNKGCLMSFMRVLDQKIISHTYAAKEGMQSARPWFKGLKEQGLNPLFIVMDGEQSVTRAARETWPHTPIQRCLRHIQREGLRWLRTFPKLQAAKDLRGLLKDLCSIRTLKERDRFIDAYNRWCSQYRDFVMQLPNTDKASFDLKRTITLMDNALPDMFHYLFDPNIPHTTNTLESFHSRLKADYRRHRGLTKQHKLSYLNWYCYFKNQRISNTF